MSDTEYNWAELFGTDIDLNTGMPALPEGYFWRVKAGYLYTVEVQLRRMRFWRFSQAVEYSVGDDASETGIRDLAAYVLHNWQERLAQRTKRDEIRARFGDYPPKKLGNN